jgi:hypothetical protein
MALGGGLTYWSHWKQMDKHPKEVKKLQSKELQVDKYICKWGIQLLYSKGDYNGTCPKPLDTHRNPGLLDWQNAV